jgi:hypothetical protein
MVGVLVRMFVIVTRVGSVTIAPSPIVTTNATATESASLKMFVCAFLGGKELRAPTECVLMIAMDMAFAWQPAQHLRRDNILQTTITASTEMLTRQFIRSKRPGWIRQSTTTFL